MAHRTSVKTAYEELRTIQPIYSGGSVALSEDGKVLATTLAEDVLLIDIASGVELARIEGDGEIVTTLALTPRATHVAICSRSLSLRIYSLSIEPGSSRILPQLERTLRPHSAPVISTAIDHTGSLLATGGADGIVKVWDIRGGYATHNFHGHGGLVTALLFFDPLVNEDGSRDRSKSAGGEAVESGHHTAKGPTEWPKESTTAFRLASGAEDGKIRIWNLVKRASIAVLDSHVSVVRSLDFSVAENALVSASRDKTAIIWDVRTWKPRNTIPILESLESAGFLANGSIIYTGGENGCVRLWSTEGGFECTLPQEPGPETNAVVEILNHASLPFLLSVHADQTLKLHGKEGLANLETGKTIAPLSVKRQISGTHDEVIDLAFVGRDRTLLALATNLEDIRIVYAAATPEETPAMTDAPDHYFGSDIALLKGHEDIVICMDVDWSGHWLATGAKDNTARLWRLDTAANSFSCHATFTGHAESLGAVALPRQTPAESSQAYKSPIDHPPPFLLTGSQDRTIKRWDLGNIQSSTKKASRATYTRKAHEKDINALDSSPRGDLFASASQDRTVKIWDFDSGESVGVLRGHRRGVWTVKFGPVDTPAIQGAGNRGVIATGSADKTVRIWSLSDFSCVLSFEGHSNSILKVIWLPIRSTEARDKRGAQLASAAGDGLVKVWDSNSSEEECTLDNHEDRVWALAANPETNTIVSGGADGVITFWQDATDDRATRAVIRETERVEQDQHLQNLIHASEYREAIVLALQLNHPARLLSLFQSVVESDPPDHGSTSGKTVVDEVLASLADEQLLRLLVRLRDWNTSVRTSQVAQRILHAVCRVHNVEKLSRLRASGIGKEQVRLRDLYDGIKAHTEKHYERLDELINDTYLLDFTLSQIDETDTHGRSVSMERPWKAEGLQDVVMQG